MWCYSQIILRIQIKELWSVKKTDLLSQVHPLFWIIKFFHMLMIGWCFLLAILYGGMSLSVQYWLSRWIFLEALWGTLIDCIKTGSNYFSHGILTFLLYDFVTSPIKSWNLFIFSILTELLWQAKYGRVGF